MRDRTLSPALSENEFDIADALLEQSEDDGEDGAHAVGKRQSAEKQQSLDIKLDDGASTDEEFIALAQTDSNRKSNARSVTKGGGFQAMGLDATLLKAITRKGFSVPTPIQRKTVPLIISGKDVVGMARTGSGKTAAFVLPMIQKLKAHSAQVGARALILSPSRELALQTLKVVKELGRGSDLKATLLVGGDSLEEQFGFVTTNPDILIATPGRFLHLKVEMGLDLSSIKYVVFDEADRLFEMGFAVQLSEILHALPSTRQTLLFSATLPKSLVEFARAGLHEPSLVRLDTQNKISPDLQSAFFFLRQVDKEGALLHVIQDVIKIPQGETEKAMEMKKQNPSNGKKRKRNETGGSQTESPTSHSTIIFTATKHHVEYIANLLRLCGYSVSYVYGSLDQIARKIQVSDFRSGLTHILVVTDVAARGIDIPILANVINYDFPAQSKLYLHRVGRTARAGKQGWSYSFVRDADLPYMLDLQLFLSKKLVIGHSETANTRYADDVVAGNLYRDKLDPCCGSVTGLLDTNYDLTQLKAVAVKGEKLYNSTRTSASPQSWHRAKKILSSPQWNELHPLFHNAEDIVAAEREKMLAQISAWRPRESVFEMTRQGQDSSIGKWMRKTRDRVQSQKEKKHAEKDALNGFNLVKASRLVDDADDMDEDDGNKHNDAPSSQQIDMDSASESELEVTFTHTDPSKPKNRSSTRDDSTYMSYTPSGQDLAEESAYGVHTGSNFLTEARSVAVDFTNDEGAKGFAEPTRRASGMRWDKKSKNYVQRANDEDGSRGGAPTIRGEGGSRISASFKSGRFDDWKKKNKIAGLPRVGEDEKKSNLVSRFSAGEGKRWKHKSEKAPKAADPKRDDYYKKKKRFEAAKEKRTGSFRDGEGRNEIRSLTKVRKQRIEQEKKKARNARPSRKNKK